MAGKIWTLTGGRPGFTEWVDRHPDPGWSFMPLTHITKGIGAEDIIRAGQVPTPLCDVFNEPLAYFFYGRPAYRVSGDGAIKIEAACPYCFIFDSSLIYRAKAIFAFDTGALANRMYQHVVMDEMNIADFSLEKDVSRPNRVISAVFSTPEVYFDGDVTKMVAPEKGAEPYDFHARAYLNLLASPGRNEPDDRICSIELVFDTAVPLAGNLKAVVVPHTLWGGTVQTPWLNALATKGVQVVPYKFVPGRNPEYYQALLEAAVRDLYQKWKII